MRRFLLSGLVVLCACPPTPEPLDAGRNDTPDASITPIADAGARVPVDSGAPVADAGGGPKLGTPGNTTRTIAAFPERLYDLHIPTGYDGVTPLPVVMVLHGGGGNRDIAKKTTCPNSDENDPGCFNPAADTKGFIVVYPDGTAGPLVSKIRTWNAGGGDGGWQCVSGPACIDNINEVAYFTALLADLKLAVHYDEHRVFATGHSNGAALSEALACEMPDVIAGIAPVAGGNQWSTTRPCNTTTPVLEFHGTADPCWQFDGGDLSCADNNPGSKISVPATIAGWAGRNGCTTARVTTALPDTTNDGTTVLKHVYNCPVGSEIELYEIVGGGHTWPGGSLQGQQGGVVSTDISANKVMLDFFAAH